MADFNVLHQAMESRGFTRTITSDQGNEYYLPRATYVGKSTSHTKEQILDLAKQAVLQTSKTAEILVVEYSGCTWSNLTPVRKG